MATARVQPPREIVTAKVTSKGQITIPVEIRRALGVKTGDKLRFRRQKGGVRLERAVEENVFEKWRGIGTGFPVKGKGRDAIVAFFREMRGHDDLD